MDVASWLRNLGFGQYEAAFRDNSVDADILPRLTPEDLKELGVTSVGHRRKLLDAIAELRSTALPSRPPIEEPAPSFPPEPSPDKVFQVSAERRQLTVMFCDLVGSTALSARLDPEDMRSVISAYHKAAASAIQSQGGFVAKYMGDGVLAYFGYPQAHEDDAERAVQAGLAITNAAPRLENPSGEPLHVRVGVATGIVVVGDLIGSGEASERGVVGDTPNLAARLQGIAKPDSLVIAEATRRLVGDLFELNDLGAQELKGIGGGTRAFEVLRPRSVESRFEALHGSGLIALIGREEETELLLRRWSKAKTGEGQVVLLSGEAGIGKSRLTAVLLERFAGEPHTRLRYFCSPQHTRSAFYPIIGQMERAARLTHDDTTPTRLDKLDAMLAPSSTSATDAALFAEMLSLGNDGRYPALDLTPEQRRQKTLEALVSQTVALARQNPVLMIFEDAHWADPTSLEVFSRVVERIRTLRVLLLVTFRPEFEATWIGQPHVTALTINRLTQSGVVAMIDRIVGNNLVPATIRQDIIDRTDGIPLFVEEMTKAVLEAESEAEARRTAAAIPSLALAVPASLHASLMARLDRLGPAKEVAQIGAAIGREFSHALLGAVAGKPEAELGSALARLIDAGLMFRHGVAPDASYLFKHALVQDAAYGTLLRESRRALHGRIAEVLESQFAEIAERQPELLARHWTEAALIEKSAGLWCKAGRQSLARSAFIEAVAHFTRGLSQFESLPVTATLFRDRIEAEVGLGNALIDVKGHAAPETRAAFRRARELMKQREQLGGVLDDPLLRLSVLQGLFVNAYVAFDGDLMHDIVAEFMAIAEKHAATISLAAAHRITGWTLGLTGNIAEGREHLDQALALHDPSERRRLGPTDPRVAGLSLRALFLWLLGYPEAAQADIDHAVREAREIGQVSTLMFALAITNYTNVLCRNAVAVIAFGDELIALANEKGASLRKAEGAFHQGCGLALSGRFAEAAQAIAAAITVWRSTGATCWSPLYMSFLADVHARLGQFDAARRCIDEAIAAAATSKETWCDVEINRIAGEIELLSGEADTKKAQAYLERALAIARRQKAKSFELRTAMSLARLWRDQGKPQQARDLLAPIYSWFTEGFDTLDLREAGALHDTLAI
jgi:class 3 adenylate cyclase/predicted ATPase